MVQNFSKSVYSERGKNGIGILSIQILQLLQSL